MKKNIGICFGGYCPLHQGHLDLIMAAKKENDICYVIVCGYDNEPRGLECGLTHKKRIALVKEFFKNDEQIKICSINDTQLGIDQSMSDSNWDIWLKAVKNLFPKAELLNGNFFWYVAETEYRDSLLKRGEDVVYMPKSNPISGTLIRKNPLLYWDKIASTFRPYFSKNILITGTASEGKSTLVKDIAKYFNLPYCEEYGRTYMAERNIFDTDITLREFEDFLIGQRADIIEKIENPLNPGIVVSDTDNLVTLMYASAYMHDENMNFNSTDMHNLIRMAMTLDKGTPYKWDKIFLLTPKNNFVDNGTRYMKQSSMEEREKNLGNLIMWLKTFRLWDKVELLNGNYYENFVKVRNYILNLKSHDLQCNN